MQPTHYRLRDDDQICFIHIPKTAGTTISSIIEAQFAQHEICTFDSWSAVSQGPSDLSPYRLIKGHIFYSIGKLLPKKPVYMTILRDPIERTLSQFEMLRQTPEYILYDRVRNMSFPDYIKDPAMFEFYANVQTRMIASDHDIRRTSDVSNAKEQIREDSLRIAKERLSEFAFVGLTERMEDSIRLLSYTFGWKPRPRFQSLNVSPTSRLKREDIPPATLSILAKRTQLDAELYQYAQHIFEARWLQMIEELLEKNYVRSFTSLELPYNQSVELTFDKEISGAGWHQREYHPAHGYFRWTGPDTLSTLDLRLDTSRDVIIEFRVIASFASDILDSLALSVNDHLMALQCQAETETGANIFSGHIPQWVLALNRSITRLSFRVNRTVLPSAFDPANSDQRHLGVALNLIKVYPVSQFKVTSETTDHSENSQVPITTTDLPKPTLKVSERASTHISNKGTAELVQSRIKRSTPVTTERVIEVPWALMQLPQSGIILDIGSCDATYLSIIQQSDRILHCLDLRDCSAEIPRGAVFHHQSIIGNDLPRQHFDAVLLLSTLEHIGLPCYGQAPFADGDKLALAEVWEVLKPGGLAIVTVPAGQAKVASWYRQYSPAALHRLFKGWRTEFSYWGFDGSQYVPIDEDAVECYDYRDYPYVTGAGAGAFAGIVAHRS